MFNYIFDIFWPRGDSGVILAENRVKSDDVFTIERLLFGSLFVLVRMIRIDLLNL